MKIVVSTTLGLLLAANVAMAEKINCNPQGNQMEINQCAANDFAVVDKKLNDTWEALLNKFKSDKTATARLRAAQKAWVVFRDAEIEATFACNDHSERCWGSTEPMMRNIAMKDLTAIRTQRLQKYNDEGLGIKLGN